MKTLLLVVGLAALPYTLGIAFQTYMESNLKPHEEIVFQGD